MKKLIIACSLLLSTQVFSGIEGDYTCSDGGKLSLSSFENNANHLNASLDYKDGSSSYLAMFEFKDSKKGILLCDDANPYIGTFRIFKEGRKIVLKFISGKLVNCLK